MQAVQSAKPFGYLQDSKQVEVAQQFGVKGQMVSFSSENGKLTTECWSYDSSDGYSFLVGKRIVKEWDVISGYRIAKTFSEGDGKECQITLYGPNDLAMRIDHLVLPEFLRTLSCPCCMHTPDSTIGRGFCEVKTKEERFNKVKVTAVIDTESKKTYLIALVPVEDLIYSVISIREKPNVVTGI
ncbi:MAG: hypothetical protein LLF94_08795 [Chlamydiales bacterium]|nr:hypothetical protein [Chlamydiales bacterium]